MRPSQIRLPHSAVRDCYRTSDGLPVGSRLHASARANSALHTRPHIRELTLPGAGVKIPPTRRMAEGQKHLLIVDDEQPLREAIAERLADHGFVVQEAASGEEALERLTD